MQSPMPPGRISRRRTLLNGDGELHVQRSGALTRDVVARLIAKLAFEHRDAWRGLRRNKKLGLDSELAREDVERVGAHLHLFGRRISNGLRLERPRVPGQLQRDQKLIFRPVAVDMKPRGDSDSKRVRDGRSAFRRERLRRSNGDYLFTELLRRYPARQGAADEERSN